MMLPGLPWPSIVNFLSTERMLTEKNSKSIPHIWMKKSDAPGLASLMETRKATGKLVIEASPQTNIRAKNVAAVIEGTDPSLRNEWIIISAHYDHVGVKKNPSQDSIYNGARDNAIGTVALLQAAKFFGKNRPKRPIMFLALTGEEKGLLGSEWYTNHPLIPLNQTVFNLNCDGAGYNDTTMANLIDLNRISADEHFKKSSTAFGLELKGDPAPVQNLYERSDNVNFAVKGVPAVTFSPGVKEFDQELMKYYHQPPDEVNSLNMRYIEKFHRAFVYAAYLVVNAKERPLWVKGDKFEEAGRKLYGK
jgi:Iap family predicted aminopeptidase